MGIDDRNIDEDVLIENFHPLVLAALEGIVVRIEVALRKTDKYEQAKGCTRFSRILEQVSVLHKKIEDARKTGKPFTDNEISVLLYYIEASEN